MKTVVALLPCMMLIGLSLPMLASGDDAREDGSAEWRVLEHTVQEVMTAGELGPYSARVAPQAQFAIGDSLLDLGAVLTGSRADLFRAYQNRPPVSIRRKMNAEKNAAFLLVEVPLESKMGYHTIVFMKDSSGTWMIESWHASR